ncbi:hypothetical protein [Streptomyces luteogriseus]
MGKHTAPRTGKIARVVRTVKLAARIYRVSEVILDLIDQFFP